MVKTETKTGLFGLPGISSPVFPLHPGQRHLFLPDEFW
jgi:hypothetical protein